MYAIEYTLKTLAPVLITSSAGEINTVNTASYIPGSSILGCFAQRYIKNHCTETAPRKDDRFCKWFSNGTLTFTNAYIASSAEGQQKTYFPAPLSLVKTKYGNPKQCPGYDLIFYQRQDGDPPTEGIKGGFVRETKQGVETGSVKRNLQFHHARERETGTPEDEKFFNYESLNPGQSFRGLILGEQQELKAFLEFLKQDILNVDRSLYLGRSKNAQYGEVALQLASKDLTKCFSEIAEWKEEWLEDIEDKGEVSLTLLSDLILYNQHGFSSADISLLEERLGGRIVRAKSVIKTGLVENFYSAWGLPKPADVCFKAGSSILLQAAEDDEERLVTLQKWGVGERRQEGFGRIVLGWQKSEQETVLITKPERKNVEQPQDSIPALAKTVVEQVVHDGLEKIVQVQALSEARNFLKNRPPSKSLAGRLEAMIRQKANDPQLRQYVLKVLNDPPKAGAGFKLTEQSFEALGKEEIPSQLLECLKPLEDQDFPSKKIFLDTLKEYLKDEQVVKHETLLLEHAATKSLALKKTAKGQLKRCRSDKQTLFDFLNTREVRIEELLRNYTEINTLNNVAGLSLNTNQKLAAHLYRLYLITFFSALRKNIAATQKGGQ